MNRKLEPILKTIAGFLPWEKDFQYRSVFRFSISTLSGRKKVLEFRHFRNFILFFALPLSLICLLSMFYTPILHYMGGDHELMKLNSTTIKTKVQQELKAGLVNPWVIKSPPPDSESALPTVRIYVNENKYNSLDREILRYGFGEYAKKPKIRGYYQTPDRQLYPVKFGYRGRNSWHHQYWKPSLNIRFKKGNLVDGYRRHLLTAPEDGTGIRNWLSQKLADEWGMLTYKEDFVRLYLNGHYRGVYTRYFPMDESLLIHQNKLPGPFLRQEVGKGPVFRKIYMPFFSTESFDIEGAEVEEGVKTAQTLLDAIEQYEPVEQAEAISTLFDKEAMTKFLVLYAHASSDHYFVHNIAYWLDKTSGLLVPLPVDVNGYGMYYRKGNYDESMKVVNGNHYTKRWLQDPRNLMNYIDSLYSFVKKTGSVENVHGIIDSLWIKIKPDLEADYFVSDLGTKTKISFRTPMALSDLEEDKNRVKKFITDRNREIKRQIFNDSIYLTMDPGANSFEVITVGVSGICAFRKSQPNKQPDLLLPTYSLINEEVFAFYKLEGRPEEYEFKHRISNKVLPLLKMGWYKYQNYKSTQGIHYSVYPQDTLKKTITLGPGILEYNNDQTFDAHTNVTISAGTQIFLAESTSLFFRGSINIQGTKENPVIVRPKIKGKPFGVFAITGKGNYETKINGLDLREGSNHKHLNIYYSGMFSIRDRKNVEIKNSVFGENFLGDDAVHLVRSTVKVENTRFENSLSDAVDFDKVDGSMVNSTFYNCGNDCFDISMSEMISRGNQFLTCGDKCISVGENSKIYVDKAKFVGGSNGVAIKDRSRAMVYNSTFTSCDTSINAFNKKWRWELGGTGYFSNVKINPSNSLDVFTGRRSKIFFKDEVPSLSSNQKEKRIRALESDHFPKWEVL